MGRFFSLDELGRYGLAFGATMLAVVAFGFRLDYVLSREILGIGSEKSRRIGTTISWLYVASFVLGAPVALFGLLAFAETAVSPLFILLVYLLCCAEAYANFLYTTTIALKRPALANGLFFIRSGAWTVPSIALSYFLPALRTAEFVLVCWVAGVSLSILLNLWTTRRDLVARKPPTRSEWREVGSYVQRSALVWVGSIGVTLGGYVDRFVVARFMTLSDVGIATFYLSFTTSVLTLVQAATTSVTFPALIEHYDRGDRAAYRRELIRTTSAAAILGAAIILPLALAMPYLAQAMHKPSLAAAYPAFLVLLAGTWVRITAETIYYALFVHRQHLAIWLGNILFLAASFALNIALIPAYGLMGLAIAALLSAVALIGWRAGFMLFAKGGDRA
jgi:O-antigen/teichoic acid export membrane protein